MNSILTGHDIRLTGLAIHLIARALQGKNNLRKPADQKVQQRSSRLEK